MHLSDIKLPQGVESRSGRWQDPPVASITIPRAEEPEEVEVRQPVRGCCRCRRRGATCRCRCCRQARRRTTRADERDKDGKKANRRRQAAAAVRNGRAAKSKAARSNHCVRQHAPASRLEPASVSLGTRSYCMADASQAHRRARQSGTPSTCHASQRGLLVRRRARARARRARSRRAKFSGRSRPQSRGSDGSGC